MMQINNLLYNKYVSRKPKKFTFTSHAAMLVLDMSKHERALISYMIQELSGKTLRVLEDCHIKIVLSRIKGHRSDIRKALNNLVHLGWLFHHEVDDLYMLNPGRINYFPRRWAVGSPVLTQAVYDDWIINDPDIHNKP